MTVPHIPPEIDAITVDGYDIVAGDWVRLGDEWLFVRSVLSGDAYCDLFTAAGMKPVKPRFRYAVKRLPPAS